MLKIVYIVLLGVILSSCASNYQDFDTYKGDMPFIEGTPTQELLEELEKRFGTSGIEEKNNRK